MGDESHEKEGVNGESDFICTKNMSSQEDYTLYAVLHRLMVAILSPDPHSSASSSNSLFDRIRASFSEHGPHLQQASRNTGRQVVLWTRRGSPLRALLVISVGTIALLAMTGLLVFFLFFLAATINAIVISLLMSLAAAGGFLAIFFTCVTAIYIGALSVAVFVISTATISAIIAVLITTGWIGFFWIIWLATKKSAGLAKNSFSMTGSALSAYSSAWHVHRHQPEKVAD